MYTDDYLADEEEIDAAGCGEQQTHLDTDDLDTTFVRRGAGGSGLQCTWPCRPPWKPPTSAKNKQL
jgi:hypothetical protein